LIAFVVYPIQISVNVIYIGNEPLPKLTDVKQMTKATHRSYLNS
jgi:hypothetical protein